MYLADGWKDYEIIDAGNDEKLERWGKVILLRPDPQAIWPMKSAGYCDAHYIRSSTGGGAWNFNRTLPESWVINYRRGHAESLGVREMASCFSSFSFKGDERRLLVAPEYNAEVVLILFAFRNRACHIVVQPHNNLAEADLASSMIVPVIEIAFDVVGTPFHKLFLKVSSPCL